MFGNDIRAADGQPIQFVYMMHRGQLLLPPDGWAILLFVLQNKSGVAAGCRLCVCGVALIILIIMILSAHNVW